MAELRKRGLITAVVCSNAFLKLGQTQAKIFGVPDLPLLVIQHPLGGLDLDSVKGRAEVATPQFVKLIQEHVR
ncbi:MAG: hypothetical protein JWM26_2541 [Betaproteobacteria bacterium]|jgi:hypothetical protein|nr:hypothetical protein [Betaproteobacteria bacterium]